MNFKQDAGILDVLSSNLLDQTGHVERSKRCLLRHLHHNGVTCSQSRSQFPRLHQQREIPLAEKENITTSHILSKSKEEIYARWLSACFKQNSICTQASWKKAKEIKSGHTLIKPHALNRVESGYITLHLRSFNTSSNMSCSRTTWEKGFVRWIKINNK